MHIGKTSVRLKFKPGAQGTKSLVEKYGDRLGRVRCRYDPAKRLRYKTAEITVNKGPWIRKKPITHSYVLVHWKEKDLQTRIKAGAGKWNINNKLRNLGLKGRIVEG
jgi:hypothetical protein